MVSTGTEDEDRETRSIGKVLQFLAMMLGVALGYVVSQAIGL